MLVFEGTLSVSKGIRLVCKVGNVANVGCVVTTSFLKYPDIFLGLEVSEIYPENIKITLTVFKKY